MPKPINNDRSVIHPLYRAVWHVADPATVAPGQEHAPPIDSELAVKLLGLHTEESNGPKFGENYLFLDRYGKKVRCDNNVRNRPLYASNYEGLVQNILRLRWEMNGEAVIVGKTGIDLNGQHTLIAVYLAQQDMERNPKLWGAYWPSGKIAIEKVIHYGISEEDRVVNTMDTCRPRSLPDVIYRSPYFGKLDQKDRFTAATMLDHAVRHLWGRTGVMIAGSNYSMRRTHPEEIDFIERHRTLLKCVKHIMGVNKEGRVNQFVGKGYAAATLYLMASSETPVEDSPYYSQEDDRTEKGLDWSNFQRACDFWTEFAKPTKEGTDEEGKVIPASKLACLHMKIIGLTKDDGTPGSPSEKDYLVVQAWKKWTEKKGVVTAKDLSIKYSKPDNKGRRHIIDAPDFGGIDLGPNFVIPKQSDDPEPTPEEVNGHQEAKEEIANGQSPPGRSDWSWIADLKDTDQTVGVVLAKNSLGKFQAWGEDGQVVSEVCDLEYNMHPKGLPCATIAKEKLEEVTNSLTDAGHTVGVAEEIKGKWEFTTIYRPKKKGGKSK